MGYKFEKKRLYSMLGQELVETLKTYNCFVAGGTITSLFCNREVKDFDVYFRSEKDLVAFMYDVWGTSNWIVSSTGKATAMLLEKKEVQVIHFDYFNSAEEIFNTFDFTSCMGAFDFKTEEFSLHPDFMRHNSQRVLKFNPETAFPIVSLLRVAKYQDKGYKISKTEYIKIVLTCMEMSSEITNYEQLKDQLGGMYGINYDKMFEEIEDEEFSLKKAIEYISDLEYDDEYYEKNEPQAIHRVEDILENIVGDLGIKYFTLGKKSLGRDKYYLILPNGDVKTCYVRPEKYEEISASEYFKDLKVYKFVKKLGGHYCSYHDDSFAYEIGAEVVPKNKYLYFNTFGDLESSPFCNNEDKACLEVEFDIEDLDDFGVYGCEIKLTKCRVIREVPKGEWIKKTKIKDDEECWF
jgi:hypothetical protein